MTTTHEWESIDDSLFLEATGGEPCVNVDRTRDYMTAMSEQNRLALVYLKAKYPDRLFRLSKWHAHDFGDYQEVEERIEYEELDDEESE